MIAITTVAELDALPVGATVMSPDGWAYRKIFGGKFIQPGDEYPVRSDHVLKAYPSLRLVHVPAGLLALAMTKCVADNCQSSHALPPGSSYACPDHSNHITLGES